MHPRPPFLTLTLTTAALAIHIVPGASEALQFDRVAVAHGEAWRWLTAHLTHFGANHLAWDVAVLLALGAFAERASAARFHVAMALAALTITPAVWFWQPQFETYRGLSGLDSAAFALLAGSLLHRPERAARFIGALAFAGVAAKSGFELATQQTLFADGAGYAPVPLAHLVGLLAGIVAAVCPARLLPAALLRQPLRRLVHEARLFKGRRHEAPARLARVDAA